MDAITHGLAGALIARLGPSEKLGAGATACAVVCAVLPDVDYALLLVSPDAYYLHHREVTHSLLGGLVLATVVAAVAYAAARKGFWAFWGVSFAGFLSHVLLDACTPFGTELLYPFSHARFAWDVLFLVDPWFSAVVFLAVAVGFAPKWRSRAALWGLALAIGYIGGCAVARQVALQRTRKEMEGVRGVQRVDALPVPGNPLAWRGVVTTKAAYYGFVWHGAGGRPVREVAERAFETLWVLSAEKDPIVDEFLRTARFPQMHDQVDESGHHLEVHDWYLELAMGRPYFVLRVEEDAEGKVLDKQCALRERAEPAPEVK